MCCPLVLVPQLFKNDIMCQNYFCQDQFCADVAAEALDQEKITAAVFQRLPFHYLEISKILFMHAKEAFGADLLKVCASVIASSILVELRFLVSMAANRKEDISVEC